MNGVLTHRYSVDFAADWFNNLAESTDEYVVNVAVEDSNGKTARMDVRVANMKEAYTYKAPVIVNIELLRSDFTVWNIARMARMIGLLCRHSLTPVLPE